MGNVSLADCETKLRVYNGALTQLIRERPRSVTVHHVNHQLEFAMKDTIIK